MSLDDLARASTTALLDAAEARTDTVAGRRALRASVRMRRRVRVAVVAVVVAAVGGALVTVAVADRSRPQPAAPHHPSAILVCSAWVNPAICSLE